MNYYYHGLLSSHGTVSSFCRCSSCFLPTRRGTMSQQKRSATSKEAQQANCRGGVWLSFRNLIRIIPGFSETIYDPHLEHFLGTSIGYHFEWAGSSIYIGQQIFVHKSSPSRRSSVQNNNILAIVLKRALGIRHSMAMVCLLLESTPCLLFIVILFFYLIKRSLKLGHVSMSTRPSATALPGSRVSGAL
jgi:hypothetical protein